MSYFMWLHLSGAVMNTSAANTRAAKALHSDISRLRRFKISSKFYQYLQETVVRNNPFKIVWDFIIQTDYKI